MDTRAKFDYVEKIQKFASRDGMTSRDILDLIGVGRDIEWDVNKKFKSFSWAGKKALTMALVVNEVGKRNRGGKLAMLEMAKVLPVLQSQEVLAVMIGMEHGKEALNTFRSTLKIERQRRPRGKKWSS